MNQNALAQRAVSAYRNVRVTTSSPVQVVVELYDGAIRFMREARAAHERGDRAAFGEKIRRAHAIIDLLATTIVAEHNPTLADRLTALYTYALNRLTIANVRFEIEPLDEQIRILSPLRDAWCQAGVARNSP